MKTLKKILKEHGLNEDGSIKEGVERLNTYISELKEKNERVVEDLKKQLEDSNLLIMEYNIGEE